MLKNLFYKLFNKSSKYRQNVGIIIMNGNKIWSGHRIDRPSDDEFAWQMPQGGIDRNEDIITASYREALEETGIKGDKLELIKLYKPIISSSIGINGTNGNTNTIKVETVQ